MCSPPATRRTSRPGTKVTAANMLLINAAAKALLMLDTGWQVGMDDVHPLRQ